ncbi:MAG TPA: radical SAM protein [Pseudomonadota bacterium]|nr:radical SAM protein [Pseudomonadota bacterium]
MSLAPPIPAEGVVSWNINTACNYRCSYCTQRFMEDRGRWSRDTPRFLAGFAKLPGRWEIKMSGGEPFVHPTIHEITAGLAEIGHRISIVTNFSASVAKLREFVDAARGRVGVFSCSLHREYVTDVAAFIQKAQWMRDTLLAARDESLPPPSLNVTTVATRQAIPDLVHLASQFAQAGVTFKIQPEKIDGGIIEYSEQEREQLVSLGGHNRTGQLAHVYTGEPCWSGARYFILDDRGVAYRCYPARRHKMERLGDFLSDSFALFLAPRPCPYPLCYCTVPIERGLMRKPSPAGNHAQGQT